MSESNIKVNIVSKPFIISAVIFVFAGSIIGSIWMMSLLGAEDLGFASKSFSLHRTFQVDGFLTLLIMGVGYMIVPRFRNVKLSFPSLAYLSFALIILSIVISTISALSQETLLLPSNFARFLGVSIFTGIMIWMLRIHPRLLRTADYFIGLSVVVLLLVSLFHVILAAAEIAKPSDIRRRNGNIMMKCRCLCFLRS